MKLAMIMLILCACAAWSKDFVVYCKRDAGQAARPLALIGFVGNKKLPGDYEQFVLEFYDSTMSAIARRIPNVRVSPFGLANSDLSKITDLPINKKENIRTYLPERADISDSSGKPEILLLIRKVNAKDVHIEGTVPLPIPGVIGMASGELNMIRLTITYVVWDNATAKPLAYGETSETLDVDANGIQSKKPVTKLAATISDAVVGLLVHK